MIPPKRDDMGRDKIGKVCKAMNSKKEQGPQQRSDVGRQVWDAASRGDLESLTSCLSPSLTSPPLLAEALNYQDPDFKRTPLFRACGFGGSLEVVRYLLSFPEVDPNLPSTEEVAPLSIACQQGHLGIVRALLADPRVKVDHLAQGLSPLYIACQWGKEDVVSALLEDGRIDPNLSLPNGTSPLYIACELNRGEVVKLLLRDPRVDVNRVRDSGVSPLFVACQEGHVGLVRQLLACPRVRVNIFSATRTSPLWIAGQNGHLEVVRWMLACSGERVDVEVPTVEGPAFWNGLNAAQQAERRGHHQIAALLREYEGDWQATRARLRLQLRLTAKEASETFSLMVLHSDGYLRVKPPGGCPCSSSSSPCLSPSSRLDSSPSSPSSCEASPSSSLSSLGLQDLCPTPDPSLCSLASPCSPCSSSSSLGLASYSTLEENQARFFAIGSRLPMELQMMLALRLHRLAVSHITIQDTDEAVRKVFTHT